MAISVGWKTFTVARKARRGGGGGGMELSFVAAEGGSHSRDSLAPRLRRVSPVRTEAAKILPHGIPPKMSHLR